jgi:predicted component of type VI protein secretion system
MRFHNLFVLAVAVTAGMVEVNSPLETCVVSAGGEAVFGAEAPPVAKGKNLDAWLPPGDTLGFTQKERPFALERVLPGVTGAVRLNDEQKQKLAAAIEETIDRREVRAAMATAKLNPNATEAQKQEARRLIEQARADLQKRVAQILAPEQKKLIERINAAAAEAQRQTSEAMQDDLLAIKTDPSRKEKVMKEYQQRVRSGMESRVLGLLDAEGQAAFKKAAAAQAAAEKVPKKGPKGQKE